jgi:phosphate:Na+ symporter
MVTGLMVILLMPVMIHLLADWLGLAKDPVTGLALFHSLFNLLGVLMFFPFIHLLGKFADKIIKEKRQLVTMYIHLTPAEVTEGAVSALHNEGEHLLRMVTHYISESLGLNEKTPNQQTERSFFRLNRTSADTLGQYLSIKSLQASIFQYAAEVQKHDLSIAEAGELNDILHSVRYAVSAAKSVKDILHDLDVIDESEEVPALQMREKFNQVAKSYLKQVDHVLSHPDAFDLAETIYTGREALYRIENEHILQITGILKGGNMQDSVISGLLSANRNICTAGRKLFLSTKDLMLSASQTAIYEKLDQELKPGNTSNF